MDHGDDMTPFDHLSSAGATLAQICYAQEHLVGDEGKNSEDYDWAGFKDEDYEDDDDDSKDGDFTMLEAGAGNNLVKDSTCCGLFEYSDDDYNHLDDDDINEEEMRIENGDIKRESRQDAVEGISLWVDRLSRNMILCLSLKPMRPNSSI